MDQKWIHILVILVVHQKITSATGENKIIKDGQSAEIKCEPSETGSMAVWFRLLDQSGMEFIASFSSNGVKKTSTTTSTSSFSYSKITQHVLILQSFNKTIDSGFYSCASLYKGIELKFGKVTQLVGEKSKEAQLTTMATAKKNRCTTATACVCKSNEKGETSFSMFCTPIILGPLVGGCGLLLLLLIITALYCNKMRTRRCPHHYKRNLHTTAAGKQMTTKRRA